MATKKPIVLCAGLYTAQLQPLRECSECQHYTRTMQERGHWMAPPDFDEACPEKLPKDQK